MIGLLCLLILESVFLFVHCLSATSLRHLGLLLFSPFCCLHSLQAHCMPPRSLNSPRLYGPRFISSLASLPPLALPNTVHLSLKAGGRYPVPASLCLFLYLDPRLRGQMIWPLAAYVITLTLTSLKGHYRSKLRWTTISNICHVCNCREEGLPYEKGQILLFGDLLGKPYCLG